MLRTQSLKELLDERQEIKWVIPGLLPVGVTGLCGGPKVGKSWLALDLCLCAATGRRFLGKFEIYNAASLYLSLDNKKDTTITRSAKLLADDIIYGKDVWGTRCLIMTNENGGPPSLNEVISEIKEVVLKNSFLKIVVIDVGMGINVASDERFPPKELHELAVEHELAIIATINIKKTTDIATVAADLGVSTNDDPRLGMVWFLRNELSYHILQVVGSYIETELCITQEESGRWSILGEEKEEK